MNRKNRLQLLFQSRELILEGGLLHLLLLELLLL